MNSMEFLFNVLIFMAITKRASSTNTRVSGGGEVTPHAYPFQAYLEIDLKSKDINYCGGSLISTHAVLTAAQCVHGGKTVKIILGAHNIQSKETSQVIVTSSNFIIHPSWTAKRKLYDIAIVKLKKGVCPNQYIAVIAMSFTRPLNAGKLATITGWGRVSDSAVQGSSVLRYGTNKVITNTECKSAVTVIRIRCIHICVSGTDQVSSCAGDTGGPLTIEENGVLYQIGVAPYINRSDCGKGIPSVYIRVTSCREWITENAAVVDKVVVWQLLTFIIFLLFFTV